MAWGEYPAEYNPKVHGTYMPSRYYGKLDTKFGQLKLAEIPAWIGRRNKSPIAAGQAIGRAWWRWRLKYMDCVNGRISGPVQVLVGLMAFSYAMNYKKYTHHNSFKYHW